MVIDPTSSERYRGPLGSNAQGWPIYLHRDLHSSEWRHVVVLPDGRVFYSDAAGHIGHVAARENNTVLGATIFGLGGLALGGPVGGIVGAIIGAVASETLFAAEGGVRFFGRQPDGRAGYHISS